MTLPPELRRAYERGRARHALLESTPVALLPLLCLCLSKPSLGPALLACGLPLAFGAARWLGQAWGRGALLGAMVGAPALLAPLCLIDPTCAQAGCTRAAGLLCVSVGALAGAAIGAFERDLRAISTAAVLATAASALGCWPLGLGVVGGAALALALGAVGGRVARGATA